MLLAFNGHLYAPGDIWFRIDPVTLQSVQLVPTKLPEKHRCRRWGVSSHYGLVGWKNWAEFYRIQVTP